LDSTPSLPLPYCPASPTPYARMARLALALMCLGASSALAQLRDEVAFIHRGVQSHSRSREGEDEDEGRLLGRLELLAQMAGKAPAKPTIHFNCTGNPALCKAPFNCQHATPSSNPSVSIMPVAKNGHANPSSFCALPKYFYYIRTCLVNRDFTRAAKIHYQSELRAGVSEVPASTCFLEGHCSDKFVNENTTLEEAEKMCDARFGHAGWAQWSPGMDAGLAQLMNPFIRNAVPNSGLRDQKITSYFTKLACAMGNYHCDVMTCKETYCNNPYYIEKYGSLGNKGKMVTPF